jgi:hypothetical protein
MNDRQAKHRRLFLSRAVIPRASSKGSPGGISTYFDWIPFGRTSRHRTAVAGGALLLLVGLAWGSRTLLTPEKEDCSKTWFSVEFTTNNEAHPVHLTLPDGKEGIFDLLMIENLSKEPLSLLAFSSRPRVPDLPADQIMSAWAQWIATSRQGIIVQPRTTWVLNPNDLDHLPSFHGHTWISVFFSGGNSAPIGSLPARVLPPSFHGRFRVHYCLTQLPEEKLVFPQLHRQALVGLLRDAGDAGGNTTLATRCSNIAQANGLSAAAIR